MFTKGIAPIAACARGPSRLASRAGEVQSRERLAAPLVASPDDLPVSFRGDFGGPLIGTRTLPSRLYPVTANRAVFSSLGLWEVSEWHLNDGCDGVHCHLHDIFTTSS
jgi:hypothetical protein